MCYHVFGGSNALLPFASGYLVVMPSLFRPGLEEQLSVTIIKPSEPIYVEAKLFSGTGQLVAEAGHEIFGQYYTFYYIYLE